MVVNSGLNNVFFIDLLWFFSGFLGCFFGFIGINMVLYGFYMV